MNDSLTDRDLLEAFRAGRRDALERVYRDHVHQIASLFRRGFMYVSAGQTSRVAAVASDADLEVLVQEVFARAFAPRTRLAYDGVRPYGAFLGGIARNVALDDLRRRARRGEVIVPPEDLDRLVDASDDPPTTEDERRGRDLVTAFIAEHCDDRDRRNYRLRFERELSQVDAADEAGLTRIQVRRWESKFRARLLRYLKRAGYTRPP